jgi:hypothetical protein
MGTLRGIMYYWNFLKYHFGIFLVFYKKYKNCFLLRLVRNYLILNFSEWSKKPGNSSSNLSVVTVECHAVIYNSMISWENIFLSHILTKSYQRSSKTGLSWTWSKFSDG